MKNGICLATNYLAMAGATRQMWVNFDRHLRELGSRLVLLSTTPCQEKVQFPIVEIPGLMRDFERFGAGRDRRPEVLTGSDWELLQVDAARSSGLYGSAEAIPGLFACRAFLREILEALQPGSVLAWDSTSPLAQVLHRLCTETGIPTQFLERGLLPETLMLESRGIMGLSDLRCNWLARGQFKDVSSDSFERIRDYYLTRKPQKYDQPEFQGGGAALRDQLGLRQERAVVFFGHYDPCGMIPADGVLRRYNSPGFASTFDLLVALASLTKGRQDVALVFKPHPLDKTNYPSRSVEGVRIVKDVNVHALMDMADLVVAQFTTLQYEAAIYDKPVLLAGAVPWSGRDATYEAMTPEDLEPALDAALRREGWQERLQNARKFIAGIMQGWLVGCNDDVPTIQKLPDLARFVRDISSESQNTVPDEDRTNAALQRIEHLKHAHLGSSTSRCEASAPIRVVVGRGGTELELFKVEQRDGFANVWQRYFEAQLNTQNQTLSPEAKPFRRSGVCVVCNKATEFATDYMFSRPSPTGVTVPCWRERQICDCGLNCRQRSCFHLLRALLPDSSSEIYCTEQSTELFRYISRAYPRATGSEYLGRKTRLGAYSERGIRNEDLTQLTFPDGVFDCVFSLDVLEHVPDYHAGLREAARVLRPDGLLLLTAPFHFHEQATIIRAKVTDSGEISHILPPVYHGDPLDPKGVLCFNDFGWDLLDVIKASGFCDVVVNVFTAPEYGYNGLQYAITARRESRVNGKSHRLARCHAPKVPLDTAKELLVKGQAASALAAAEHALREQPDCPDWLTVLAEALFEMKHWDRASELYRTLVQLFPGERKFWERRWACCVGQGHSVLAELIQEEALTANPDWASNWGAELSKSALAAAVPAMLQPESLQVEGRCAF